MKKIDLLYFDAGGGHRSAANALKEVIERQGRPWRTELVNIQEALDELDIFRKLLGIRLEDCYNLLLNKGWTLGSPQLTRAMQFLIRIYHPSQVRVLEKLWRERQPDLLVSMVPNVDRAIGESARNAVPRTPLVTILTDIADYPPHFWIERQKQYLICGSQRAVEQARELGHEDSFIFLTSGMILNPRFYEPMDIDRAGERRKLGLDPGRQTGLVMFGGQGSNVMEEIARRLDTQLICICGKNGELAGRLRALKRPSPTYVEGFTRQVPYYMRLADFFIGKPGPGSLSEALAMKLPVIVERNAWTLPQERYNAEWILENGVGIVLPNFRGIAAAVADLLEPAAYARYRAAAEAQENRAVFEIPDILQKILERKW
ncbi:MAG TPA: glycosyltransferase [Bryobacteraceae bacterium]|jgi:glycosyl transferase family 28|nr:glycosyltransferase [Bryobacteraceae bacterium]